MINRVVLIGRLTKDPELRKTASGLSTCSFTTAVDRPVSKKDAQQNGEQTADFIACVAWRQQADYLTSYGHKGDLIGVEGRIQTRNYDDKDGRKVYVTEVVCNTVQLLGGRQQPQPRSSAEYRQQKAEAKAEAQPNPYSMKSIKETCTSDPADPLNQQMSADSMQWGNDTGIDPNDLPF